LIASLGLITTVGGSKNGPPASPQQIDIASTIGDDHENKRAMLHNLLLVAVLTLTLLMTAGVTRAADPKKPNILILWGDDIGY